MAQGRGSLCEVLNQMIYLDNAATSWPKPQCVLDEMARFLAHDGGSPNRAGHRMAAAAGRIVRDVRYKLARLFNIEDPQRLIHCFNCTDALNIAIKGCLSEGDHVITTVLDHNSISRPLNAMAKAGLISLTRLRVTGAGVVDPDAVRTSITPNTRLIATLHASNVTGVIQPIASIGRIAREHDCLLLIDAAQSVGLLDVDVRAMNIDLLAFPGHKSLLGPTGTGGLYVGPRASIKPWREGGTGEDSVRPTQPTEFPTCLEAGTHNTAGLAGLNAALDVVNPPEALGNHRMIVRRLVEELDDHPHITLLGNPAADRGIGVVSLTVDGIAPCEVASILNETYSIAVRPGLHCAPYIHRSLGSFPDGTVRIASGLTTTTRDIMRLVRALREVADR
ncbi:MAG: aminotransferase class V-fold PLP-dependent enzyme [Phycisphaerae bacterium]